MTNDKKFENEDQLKYNEKYDKNITDHDYDGIKELDNPPPIWIMAVFFITILFAMLYAAHYFWFNQGESQEKEYVTQVNEYDQQFKKSTTGGELVALTDEASLTEGAQIFKEMNCFACHGQNGEGNTVGPNLCDKFWLHGCDFKSIFSTIKNGFPTKGMTPFKMQLSDERIQKVASFVFSKLKGSSPQNQKAAQGVECK